MNKTYLDSEPATPSTVGTMEVITSSTEPVTGTTADHDQQVDSTHIMNSKNLPTQAGQRRTQRSAMVRAFARDRSPQPPAPALSTLTTERYP